MEKELTTQDLGVIITSLEYSRKHIDESQDHPTYESKQSQINRVNEVLNKVRDLKKAL
jgi:hypothetical protein